MSTETNKIIFKLLNDIQKETGEKRKILEEQLKKIMSGVKQGFEKEKKDAADEKLKKERTEADKSMQELIEQEKAAKAMMGTNNKSLNTPVSKNPIKTKKKKRTPKDGGESFEQTNADVGTGTSQITDNDDPGTSRITNKFVENDPLKDGGESFEQTNAGTSASTDKNEQSAKFAENDLEQKNRESSAPKGTDKTPAQKGTDKTPAPPTNSPTQTELLLEKMQKDLNDNKRELNEVKREVDEVKQDNKRLEGRIAHLEEISSPLQLRRLINHLLNHKESKENLQKFGEKEKEKLANLHDFLSNIEIHKNKIATTDKEIQLRMPFKRYKQYEDLIRKVCPLYGAYVVFI